MSKEIIQTGFVGRESELGILKQCLDNALKGIGNFVLIKGETGVGKTKLVLELEKYAKSKKTMILNGSCFEGGSPYLPFINALSEDIITERIEPTIEDVFLVYYNGKLMLHQTRRLRPEMDSDIFASMFTAVQLFVKELFHGGSDETLNELEFGHLKIPIEHGKRVYLAVVVSGESSTALREQMKKTVEEIEMKYKKVLEGWDGNRKVFSDMDNELKKLIMGKYRTTVRLDPTSKRAKMFEEISTSIIDRSKEKALMLFFDDMQWADNDSLTLLYYIVRSTKKSRVLIVGAYRPEELLTTKTSDRGQKLIEMFRKMSRDKLHIIVELNRLNFNETSEIIKLAFSKNTFSDKFFSLLYEKTEGNPFFIKEILNDLVEKKQIYQKNGGGYTVDEPEIDVPKTVEDVIMSRVDRLDEDTIKVLQYASAIGLEFDCDTLQSTLDINEDDLFNNIDALIRTKMILELTKEGWYSFDHVMIKDVIYDGLSDGMRRMIHRKIAYAIEELNKDRIEPVIYDLARHYPYTKELEKSYEYLIRAGDKAKKSFALMEEKSYYKKALEILNKIKPQKIHEKIVLLNNLGKISLFTGDADEAMDYARSSIELCEHTKDQLHASEAYRIIGEVKERKSEWEQAMDSYKKAVSFSRDIKDIHGISESHECIGRIYWRTGKYSKAIEEFNKSLGLSADRYMTKDLLGEETYPEKNEDLSAMARGYMRLAAVYSEIEEEYKTAVKYLEQSIAISERINDFYAINIAYNNLGGIYKIYGHYDDAIRCYEKQIEYAEKIGDIRGIGYGLSGVSVCYLQGGNWEKGKECCDKALEIFKKLDEKTMVANVYANYGVIYKVKHNWDEASKCFNKSIRVVEELDTPYDLGRIYYEYARMYRDVGIGEMAIVYLEKARKSFAEINSKFYLKKVTSELEELKGQQVSGIRLTQPEFVGRDAEMKILKNCLDEAILGHGKLVLINGENGMGKSMLMNEIRKYAKLKNVCFVLGKCSQYGSESYMPFMNALTDYFKTHWSKESTKKIIQNLPPEIVKMVPILEDIGKVTGIQHTGKKRLGISELQNEQERIFEDVLQLIIKISNEEPILLFIEDIHWMSELSFHLLHYVVRNTINSRILICGTCRPEILRSREKKNLINILRQMNREKLFTEIELKNISKEDGIKMINFMLGRDDVPGSLVDFLYKKSGGNPFFIEEIVKSLVKDRAIYVQDEVWSIDSSKIRIPDTIKEVVKNRIDTLDKTCEKILEYGSVIGQNFQYKILEEVASMDEEKLLQTLDKLIDAKIISEHTSPNDIFYTFYHPIIMEVIYNNLSDEKKQKLHKEIGARIEKINEKDIDDVIYDLARHFMASKEYKKCMKYSIRAGNKAKKMFAPDEALKYYKIALGALEKIGKKEDKDKIGLLNDIGEMCYVIGELNDSLGYYDKIIKLCDSNETMSIMTYLKIGEIQMDQARYDNALENMEKALEIAEKNRNTHGMADAYYRMGKAYWRVGRLDEAINVLNKSLELCQKIDDKSLMAKVYMDIGLVHDFRGKHAASIKLIMKSLSISESINNKYEIARAYNNIGNSYDKINEVDKAIEWFERCIKISKEIGWIRAEGYGLVGAAENYVKKNLLEKAKGYTNKSLMIFKKLGEKKMVAACDCNYGMICSKEKNWEKAGEYFESAINISKEIDNVDTLPSAYFEYGKMYKSKNEIKKAKEMFENAIKVYEKLGNKVKVEEIKKEIERLCYSIDKD
jgi:adenylate cyclase